jgi:hypothetical protein
MKMKRVNVILAVFALVAMSVGLQSCQKEEAVSSKSDRKVLEAEERCIDPANPVYFPEVWTETVAVGNSNQVNHPFKTVTLTAWNTLTEFKYVLVSNYQTGVVKVNGVNYTGGWSAGTPIEISVPLTPGFACGDAWPISIEVDGGGLPLFFNETYYLVCECDDLTENPQPCLNEAFETGFGGSWAGPGRAWWFAFDTQGASVQNIYAGKSQMAGTVSYDGINDAFTVTLGNDWYLQSVSEPVKVQGYNTLPSARPAAGLFTTYKGSSLTFAGNGSRYYVIHLDLAKCLD